MFTMSIVHTYTFHLKVVNVFYILFKNLCRIDFLLIIIIFQFQPLEQHTLSFIETSALDSTNVETAFQSILTGKSVRVTDR